MEANVEIEKRICKHTNKGYQLGQSSGNSTLSCFSVWSDKPRIRYQQVSTNMENINLKITVFKSSQIHTLGIIQVRQHLLSSITAIKRSPIQSFSLTGRGSCWPTRLTEVNVSVSLHWSGMTRILFPVISAYSSTPLPSFSLKCWTWSVREDEHSGNQPSLHHHRYTLQKNVTLVQFQVWDFAVQNFF